MITETQKTYLDTYGKDQESWMPTDTRCETCEIRMSRAEIDYCNNWNNKKMQCRKHQGKYFYK